MQSNENHIEVAFNKNIYNEELLEPFPPLNNASIVNTTNWTKVKDQLIENNQYKNGKWLKLTNTIKSAPKKTKTFLGIDSDFIKSVEAKNERSPIYFNKTLVNWNERTFSVLKNNFIFGGKIKNEAIDRYIENLDEDQIDDADIFKFYKSNDGKIFTLKKKENKDESERFINQKNFDFVDNQNRSAFYRNFENEENIEGPCDAFTHAFSGRRIFGIGFCGRLFDNNLDPNKKSKYKDLLKNIKEHRPYFTYWITLVQILICLVSIFTYGLSPIGFSFTIKKGLATTISLEKQLISFPVKENFWIGPSVLDLVHLGAKYAPCMRNDSNIFKAIERDRLKEKESACCIRNDRGGCVQASKERCSELLSRWTKNIYLNSSNKIRSTGNVCGLDPDSDLNQWSDDITLWPICEKQTSIFNSSVKIHEHMYCEIIGRPCCIGIQGECVITTLEHCNLMRGYFHQEANLCSQIDCMQDSCGMIDFLYQKSPDQVYRLFTSIFIHAGLIQLLITVIFQIFILRDVEKLAGCLRVAIIYVASGIIGNLASSIFLPYQAEVGPMGCQFGIIACLFIEVYHAWEIYQKPWLVLFKLLICLIFLLLIGLLPMIDNFSNIFGFFSGMLIGSILFPNINLNGTCKRILIIGISIGITIALISVLVILFYVKPIENCYWCKFISCPFGNKYCLDMDFNITRLY